MMKQIGEEAEPASKRNAERPAGIDDVIAWLMAKNRDQRPPDLATAIKVLEQPRRMLLSCFLPRQ